MPSGAAQARANHEFSLPNDARLPLARVVVAGAGGADRPRPVFHPPGRLTHALCEPVAAFGNLFHIALVPHVDLSVLVWFVASGGRSGYGACTAGPHASGLGWLALWVTGAALAMALALFLNPASPSYQPHPALESPLFSPAGGVFGSARHAAGAQPADHPHISGSN